MDDFQIDLCFWHNDQQVQLDAKNLKEWILCEYPNEIVDGKSEEELIEILHKYKKPIFIFYTEK